MYIGNVNPTRQLLALATVLVVLQAFVPSSDPPPLASEREIGEEQQTVLLRFGGDTMLARNISRKMLQRGTRYVWGNVLPLLQSSDLTLLNLECVIGFDGEPFTPARKYYFRAHPVAIDALKVAGIDYVSLANNHAMDFGPKGILETIRRLDEAGISHSGAGKNRGDASLPARLTSNGINISVIAIADHYEEYAASSHSPGTNFFRVDVNDPSFSAIARTIKKERESGADIVVVSAHWGPNWRRVPKQEFVEYAHALIDSGADILHGHSAHIFQGIEVYKGRLILYDTGDLIDDYAIRRETRNDYQMLVSVEASRTGILNVEVIPLVFEELQVTVARGRDFSLIARQLKRLSARFNTEITERDGRLFVRLE